MAATIDGFAGTLLHPGDDGYDDARAVFNGMIDRRPSVIARCGSVDDVVAVVGFARDNDRLLSVYGGGHGVTGSAVVDDGVCLDLRGLRDVTVDPASKTARVGRGRDLGRGRRGLPGARARRHRRPRVRHRRAGPGPGQRERLAGAGVRLRVRQPARGAGRDGRRQRRHGVGRTRTPSCSGACGAAAATSASSPRSSCSCTRSGPIVYGGMLMFPAEMAGELVRFYRDFMADGARRGRQRPRLHHRAARRTSCRSRCGASR